MNVHAALADPHRYRRQIEKLHDKHLATRRIYELRQSDVPLASFVLDRRTVARRIARAVKRGEYRPARARPDHQDGREGARGVRLRPHRPARARGRRGADRGGARPDPLAEPLFLPEGCLVVGRGFRVRGLRARAPEEPAGPAPAGDPRHPPGHRLVHRLSIPVAPDSPVWPMLRDVLWRPGRARPSPVGLAARRERRAS
jgi:hypothetical protein